MKKLAFIAVTLLMALSVNAKDIKTLVVTTNPQMHCENYENKIKDNIRFDKSIKKIETSVENQTVTITYDADKTKPETLINAFGKFGYKATEVKEEKSGEAKSEKAPEKKK